MSKIKLQDTMMDVMVKMSEGNPGALTCLMGMMQKSDWYGGMDSLAAILSFDTIGLYGSNLYMLWNDCCDRDLTKLELVLRNWQMGNLSAEEIHKNISQGRGTPFENLKSLEELFA
jgi:hypothetical protein